MTKFKDKTITIIGAQRSGQEAARLVVHEGGRAKVSEQRANDLDPAFLSWADEHEVDLEFNGHTKEFIVKSDLVVLSPGVRSDAPCVRWAEELGIPIYSEIELAYHFCTKPIIAVTGSNGKTTVVNLIKEILTESGYKVCLCGNVGTPFSQFVHDEAGYDYFVLEVSSFQLEHIDKFRPFIGVLLNLSQNHLDRHADMDEYFQMKQRLFMNQTDDDYALLNAEDEYCQELIGSINSQIEFFNTTHDKWSFGHFDSNQRAVLHVAHMLYIDSKCCLNVFEHFQGVEHRLEFVRTFNGVNYINDSKATTVESGRWALASIEQPVLMICGGRDKRLNYFNLRDIVGEKVKKMFIFGEAQEKLRRSFEEVTDVEACSDLAGAVNLAKNQAHSGDCILLSPMCASFDQFKNFEERGEMFKHIVKELD